MQSTQVGTLQRRKTLKAHKNSSCFLILVSLMKFSLIYYNNSMSLNSASSSIYRQEVEGLLDQIYHTFPYNSYTFLRHIKQNLKIISIELKEPPSTYMITPLCSNLSWKSWIIINDLHVCFPTATTFSSSLHLQWGDLNKQKRTIQQRNKCFENKFEFIALQEKLISNILSICV